MSHIYEVHLRVKYKEAEEDDYGNELESAVWREEIEVTLTHVPTQTESVRYYRAQQTGP